MRCAGSGGMNTFNLSTKHQTKGKMKTTKADKLRALETLEQFTRDCRPKPDRLKLGIKVQTYSCTLASDIISAGVHWMPEITARYVYKATSHWRRWRRWYDNRPYNIARRYPAKEHYERVSAPHAVTVFPVAQPKLAKLFVIP